MDSSHGQWIRVCDKLSDPLICFRVSVCFPFAFSLGGVNTQTDDSAIELTEYRGGLSTKRCKAE